MSSPAEKQLAFLREITRCSGSEDEFEKNISSVKNVLKTYLPEIYPTHPEFCASLESAYEKLKEYAAYKQLIKKNIVSLCGKASSGKSTFFNSLYNGGILPVDTDANSAVPSYVICGTSQYSYGLNKFDHFITMTPEDMASVFSGSANDEMPLAHLFSSILTYASSPELKHIAFMDTQGYTKTTDDRIASGEHRLIQRINSSNYILWFAEININTLGISESDIRILKKLDSSIPKLIIVSKADAFNTRDIPEIIEKTKKILNARGISYIDVLTYSRTHPEKYDKYKILAYLDRWDKSTSVISFSQEFEKIFDSQTNTQKISELRNVLMPEIQKASDSIFSVQNAFDSKKSAENSEFVPVEPVQKPVNRLKNIDISKIRLTDLPVPNPEKLFRNYNDRNKLDMSAYERYINAVSIVLSETMKDIVPVFSVTSGNTKSRNDISSVICRMFNVSEEASPASVKSPEGSSGETETKSEGRSASRDRRSRTPRGRREVEPAETAEKKETASEAAPARERSSSLPSRRRLR